MENNSRSNNSLWRKWLFEWTVLTIFVVEMIAEGESNSRVQVNNVVVFLVRLGL